MSKKEIRSLRGIEEASEGKLYGYAALFDSLSEDLGGFREIIRPGAFADSLRDYPDVRALAQHDSRMVLGRTKNGTLKLEEDSRGLRVEITPPNTSAGRDIVELVRRGDIDAMSFAFEVTDPRDEEVDYTGELPTRILRRVRLFEVSLVTFPAYADTQVALRSIEDHRPRITLDLLRMRLDLAARN